MSSPIGSQQNVKIFLLYLMQNVGYPLDYITLNDVVMQTDYIAYLDFAEAFAELEEAGLVEKAENGQNAAGEDTYTVTKKGACVVDSMRGEVLASILEESLACALRFLDFQRRGVRISCKRSENSAGGYDLRCSVTEAGKSLLDMTLWVDSATRADRMEQQFRDRPEQMYRGILAMLSGKVNYLFDS